MRLIFILFLFVFSNAHAETSKLTVQGEVTLKKPADQAIITVSVVTEGERAREAMEANSKRMNQVMGALKDFGLEKSDYQTSRFQVSPQYSVRPQKAPDKWRPKIEGYQVTHTLMITTTLLKQLGDLLDVVNAAGINSIDEVRFTIKDPQTHRKEAIVQATNIAMQDAKNLSEAANVHLSQILQIGLDQSDIQPIMYNAAPMMARGIKGTVIEPGDIDVTGRVNITYELTN